MITDVIVIDKKLEAVITDHNNKNYDMLIICDHGIGPCVEVSHLDKIIFSKLKTSLSVEAVKNNTNLAALTKPCDIKTDDFKPASWSDKMNYKTGTMLLYKDLIYVVLVDHNSDKAKTPDITPEWYKLNK